MDIEAIRLDMPLITSGGIQGKVVAISKEGGLWLETADRMRFPVHVECVRSVDELRPNDTVRATGRSNLFKENVDGKVGKIDFLAVYGGVKCANVIWADGESSNVVPVAQLVKCDDWKPLAEVAKCYKQVEPEQLLLSDDAKVVCEMLRANGPMTSHEISDRWCLSERVILECLLEAKEAGIVRLDDGKYSIVRD